MIVLQALLSLVGRFHPSSSILKKKLTFPIHPSSNTAVVIFTNLVNNFYAGGHAGISSIMCMLWFIFIMKFSLTEFA